MAYSDENSYSLPFGGSFGPIGQTLFVLLLISFFGTLLAIFVGSALGPIPFIGMIALLFVPFPTLTVGLLVVLSVCHLFYRLSHSRFREIVGFFIGIAVVGTAVIAYPTIANREFDKIAARYQQRGTWVPAILSQGVEVTIVRSEHTEIDRGCGSFCLGLLLSGRAEQVTFMTSLEFDRPESLKITGKRYSFKDSSNDCIAELPRMEPGSVLYDNDDKEVIRRRLNEDFRGGLLSKDFEEKIQSCLSLSLVDNEPLSGWLFVDWRTEFDPESYDYPTPRLNARLVILNADDRRSHVTELFEIYGARIASPAWIWPYGGNAGSGGTFSPQLAREHLDWGGPSSDIDGWWRFVDDPAAIAQAAIERVKKAQSFEVSSKN